MSEESAHQLKLLKIKSAFLGIAFTVFIIATSYVVSWAFTGRDVLVVKNNPVPTSKFVDTDGTVTMRLSFCKVSKADGRVVRKLVSNKTEVLLPTYTDSSGKACYDNAPIKVPIPPQTAPGIYHINYRATYRTNPLHEVTEEFNSDNFRVVQ